MKIRNGFVSNSSSSSFIIVGVVLEETQENCKSLCDKYLSNKDVSPFTEKFCCGKKMKSQFCPSCGKNKDDIEETINYVDIFREYRWDIDGIDVQVDEGTVIVGSYLDLDLKGDSKDIDKFIKEIDNSKKKIKDLGIKGKVKIHCGVTFG